MKKHDPADTLHIHIQVTFVKLSHVSAGYVHFHTYKPVNGTRGVIGTAAGWFSRGIELESSHERFLLQSPIHQKSCWLMGHLQFASSNTNHRIIAVISGGFKKNVILKLRSFWRGGWPENFTMKGHQMKLVISYQDRQTRSRYRLQADTSQSQSVHMWRVYFWIMMHYSTTKQSRGACPTVHSQMYVHTPKHSPKHPFLHSQQKIPNVCGRTGSFTDYTGHRG